MSKKWIIIFLVIAIPASLVIGVIVFTSSGGFGDILPLAGNITTYTGRDVFSHCATAVPSFDTTLDVIGVNIWWIIPMLAAGYLVYRLLKGNDNTGQM